MPTTSWLLCACAALLQATLCAAAQLTTLHEWRQMEFTFPSTAHRRALIHKGIYLPNASVPLDVDYHKGRVFITTPRFRPGVAATLSTVAPGKGKSNLSPLLAPYPDWSWHKQGGCTGMTSVFRITIDECDRLWAIDTGSIDVFVSIRHVCPKQLFIFDLSTDKLVKRYQFPTSVIKRDDTLFTAIQVEVVKRDGKCRESYAYIVDTTGFAIVVYDMKNDRSWKVTHNTFWPIPKFGTFNLQGSEFNLMDGILGVALSPADDKPRQLYYHSLASDTEHHVATNILKHEANFDNGDNTARKHFKTFRETRLGQSAAQDISSSGILFYSELVEPSLRCYNTRTPFRGSNNPTVAEDPERLQFAAGMKVRRNQQGVEEVWILTDRLQKLMVGTMTPTEVNFRVLKGSVNQLVANTECATTSHRINLGTAIGEDGEELEKGVEQGVEQDESESEQGVEKYEKESEQGVEQGEESQKIVFMENE